MSELNQDSSSVQGDEDLLRPLPLNEDQDLQLAYEANVHSEGQEFNLECQTEALNLSKTIGCGDGSLTETQSPLEPIGKPVPKNKALVSKKAIGCEDGSQTETQASLEPIEDSGPKNKALFPKGAKFENIQFGSALWILNLIPSSGVSAADTPKRRSLTYPASFLDMKVWGNIREQSFHYRVNQMLKIRFVDVISKPSDKHLLIVSDREYEVLFFYNSYDLIHLSRQK
jgi:hypothetical protein